VYPFLHHDIENTANQNSRKRRQLFNNLQWTALLTSSVQYDKILGQQQLVMANYACGFNQSATGKHFE